MSDDTIGNANESVTLINNGSLESGNNFDDIKAIPDS